MRRFSSPRPWSDLAVPGWKWQLISKVFDRATLVAALLGLVVCVLSAGMARADSDPWVIEADRLISYNSSDVVLAEGKVRIEKEKLKVFADRVVFDRRRGQVEAYGNVVIHLGQDVLRGSAGSVDLTTRTGTMEDAILYLKRNNIYVTAQRLEKLGEEEYHATDATISTCPLPKQSWRFWCSDLKLTVDGDAWAKHATFDVRHVPILYSPVMYVPVNRYRKTGLLIPSYSTSKKSGFGISIPFFWVINDSQDMTYTPQYLAKRGWMHNVEYRHRFTEENRAILQYTALSDDEHEEESGVGNKLRWWLRGKMDQSLPLGFEGKFDVDLVSDDEFLTDFNDGALDFYKSNLHFRNWFGRSLAEASNDIRPSVAQVTRNFDDAFLGLHGRFNDNHIPDERPTTVQVLPSAYLHGFKKQLKDTGLYWSMDLDYTDYWRNEGSKERRIVVRPSLSKPLDILGWGDLVLTGAVEDTAYAASGDDESGRIDDTANLFRYRLEADLSKTLARVYGDRQTVSYRHSIMPRIRYLYRSDADDDDIPRIDRWDVYDDVHRVSFSLLSFVSRKRVEESGRGLFRDMFRINFVQNYNIRKEPAYELALDLPDHRWSDLFGEVEFEPVNGFLLRYDTAWNHYDHRFRKHNIHGNLSFPELNGSRVYFDYRYNHLTNVETGNLGLDARITRAVTVYYHVSQNFRTKEKVSSRYGLRYQASCWAVTGMITDNQDDTTYMIYVELLGIGGWTPPMM